MEQSQIDTLIKVLHYLGFEYRYNKHTGYSYKATDVGWIHFNPYIRDADAVFLAIHSQMNMTWKEGMCYVSKNQFSSLHEDWRISVIDVFVRHSSFVETKMKEIGWYEQ